MAVIKDVAKLAGVSVGTVSKYLNTPELLREETRAAVEDAIRKLNYKPNLFARNLRTQDSRMIAVITQEILNPFHAALFNTVRKEAQKYGYSAVLYSINDVNDASGDMDALFESLPIHYMSGIITGYFHDMEKSVDFANRHPETPMVVMSNSDRYFRDYDSNKIVHADFTEGIYKLTNYLISRGCRKIAYLGCKTKHRELDPKLRGFHQAMERHHMEPHSIVRLREEFTVQTGYKSAEEILSRGELPDVILSDTDVMAMGALRCVNDHGLRVPEDIMLAAFDDTVLSQFCCPRLTAVNIPIEQMSMKAVQMLMEQIEYKASKGENTYFPLELIVRESTR